MFQQGIDDGPSNAFPAPWRQLNIRECRFVIR